MECTGVIKGVHREIMGFSLLDASVGESSDYQGKIDYTVTCPHLDLRNNSVQPDYVFGDQSLCKTTSFAASRISFLAYYFGDGL